MWCSPVAADEDDLEAVLAFADDLVDFGELGGEGAAGGAPVGGEVEAADGVGEVAVAGFLLGGGVLFAVGAALLEDYVLQDLNQEKLVLYVNIY